MDSTRTNAENITPGAPEASTMAEALSVDASAEYAAAASGPEASPEDVRMGIDPEASDIAFEDAGSDTGGATRFDVTEGSEALPLDPAKRAERLERMEQVERSRKKRRRKKIVRRIMWALVILVLAALVALVILFAMFRWYTYDDKADMVGTWRLEGTEMLVEISDETIRLNEEVAYRYTIDPSDKTITFKFGNMTGQGRYRFSLDRQQLSITDGEFDFWGTLFSDIPWTVAALFDEWVSGDQLTPGIGEGVTALTKQLVALPDEPTSDASNGALDVPEGGAASRDASDAAGDGADGDQADGTNAADSSSSASDSVGSDVRDVDALDLPGDVGM